MKLNSFMDKVKSMYAIPCLFMEEGDFDPEDVFFVTMNTKNEEDAIKLASCVCGKRKAPHTLVIINERGQVFPVY